MNRGRPLFANDDWPLDPELHAGLDADFDTDEPREGALEVWAIYFSPCGFPGRYVARLFIDGAPTRAAVLTDSLDQARRNITPGLTRLPKLPGDDATLVETWL